MDPGRKASMNVSPVVQRVGQEQQQQPPTSPQGGLPTNSPNGPLQATPRQLRTFLTPRPHHTVHIR